MVQGVFHVELKYTSRGPRLIEVNCRMGGGPVRNTNLLVWGVDLVEEHLLTCAGIPSRPPIAAKPLMYIAEYSINAQKTGKMQHIDFLKVKLCMCYVTNCTFSHTSIAHNFQQLSGKKRKEMFIACLLLLPQPA